MKERVRAILAEATEGGRLPVVVASSCAEGVHLLAAEAGYTVLDAFDFVAAALRRG